MFIFWVALASGLNLLVAFRQTRHRRIEMGAFGVLGTAKAAESDRFCGNRQRFVVVCRL